MYLPSVQQEQVYHTAIESMKQNKIFTNDLFRAYTFSVTMTLYPKRLLWHSVLYVHWSDGVCRAGKGRSFLVLYAIVLVMAHPVANFNKNVMIMSNSATCGQELSYNQTKEVLNQIANPLAGNQASLPSHWRQFTVDLLLTAKNKFSRRVTDLQFYFGNP